MRLFAFAPALVLCLALPFSVACRPTTSSMVSGTTYRITGTATERGCSPGLEPIDPIVFDAEVRSSGGVFYWRLGTTPWIPGSIASDGTFRVGTRDLVEAIPAYAGTDPDFDPPRPGCTLVQTEIISGTFSAPAPVDGGVSDGGDASTSDAPAADASSEIDASTITDAGDLRHDAGPPDPTAIGAMRGTNTIELSISPGSDCRSLLAANGGAFPSFPCTVAYSLTGAAMD